MDLIIGGAYQGKLAYAMERFHLTPESWKGRFWAKADRP